MARRVIASADIDAPPEFVFRLMSTPSRYPEVVDPCERMIEVPDGDLGIGSTYREYGGAGPFKGEYEWTVTEFEPPLHQAHEGDHGTLRYRLDIDVTPTAAGCRYTQTLTIEPRGVLGILSPVLWPLLMRRLAQASMDKTVANAKRTAEAERSAS